MSENISEETKNNSKENKENTDFNFQDPVAKVDDGNDFSTFTQKKAKNIQTKMSSRSSSTNSIWLLVFVLIISFAALSVFSFTQIQKKNQEIAQYERGEVAGVSEGSVKNIVASQDFSLVLDTKTPKGFNLNIQEIDSPYLQNQKATQSTFINIIEKENLDLVSGIEVLSSQNDGKINESAFAKLVVDKLGSEYTLSENIIQLPNNKTLIKIDSSKIDGISYYAGLTEDNYYLVKVYNQTTKYPDLIEYSRFSDILLASLYLN